MPYWNMTPDERRRTLVVLRETYRLIERGWTQGAWARRSDGQPARKADKCAVSYCMRGACNAAGGADFHGVHLADEALREVTWDCIVRWNDDSFRTKEQVLRAIAFASWRVAMQRL